MDLQIIETNNGGDLVKNPKDLQVIYGFQNMPYLAMFGGNVEESTPEVREDGKQSFDWWGNNLLFPKDASVQFNSETERVLNSVPLTSQGRVLIEQAVLKDLSFFQSIGDSEVRVAVSIESDDRVLIGIKIGQKISAYIWDATMSELTEGVVIAGGGSVISVRYFDEFFALEFG